MAQADGSPKKKLRVLIADDVQETRRSTRLMLSMIPTVEVVAIAPDGRSAVHLAREHHPDIVVLDVNMPEMDGITALGYILHENPTTGCVIISAERQFSTMQAAAALGVQEFLIKPFTLDEFEQAVARVADRLVTVRQDAEPDPLPAEPVYPDLAVLADEYARTRRTDDQAVQVFEQLAADPACEVRWLRTLAMVYVIRKDWGKLYALAARLAKGGK